MQNQQNPDVNSIIVDEPHPVEPDTRNPNNIEDVPDEGERDPVPVPPDVENPYPVVDPPLEDDFPMGDVDDSPKKIA